MNREINHKIAEKNEAILALMKRIENNLYSTADDLGWIDVGDTEHVRKLLECIVDFFVLPNENHKIKNDRNGGGL